jgi:TolA-binding protein
VIQKTFASAALVLALTMPAAAHAQPDRGSAQAPVTATDIQHLSDVAYDVGNEVSRLRSRDQALADRLEPQLDDLRDEVVYLRVKLRKEGSVSRSEYNDVRSRIDSLRSQVRGEAKQETKQGQSTWSSGQPQTGQAPPPPTSTSPTGVSGGTQDAPHPNVAARRGEVPSGTDLDVRLESELSSGTAQVEDRFTATTAVDLYQGNDVLIPAGSTLRGVVSSVNKATRTDRKGSLTVAFDQITVNGKAFPIHATVQQALQSEGIKGEAGKIGAGAGVGAILGGIIGGAKGALLGILIGGGGTIAATEGKDVTLPAGTVLRVRLDQPLQIR